MAVTTRSGSKHRRNSSRQPRKAAQTAVSVSISETDQGVKGTSEGKEKHQETMFGPQSTVFGTIGESTRLAEHKKGHKNGRREVGAVQSEPATLESQRKDRKVNTAEKKPYRRNKKFSKVVGHRHRRRGLAKKDPRGTG